MKTKIYLLFLINGFVSLSCILALFSSGEPVLDWEELFPNNIEYPMAWSKSEINESCISAPLGSGCDNYVNKHVKYYFGNPVKVQATIDIKFYETGIDATNDYKDIHDFAFIKFSDSTYTDCFHPEGIIFQSKFSDQYDYGCKQNIRNVSDFRCTFVSQYNQFIVDFSLWADGEFDYQLLLALMNAIDDKMALYKDAPPVPQGN